MPPPRVPVTRAVKSAEADPARRMQESIDAGPSGELSPFPLVTVTRGEARRARENPGPALQSQDLSGLDAIFAETARIGRMMTRAPRLPPPPDADLVPLFPGPTAPLAPNPALSAASRAGHVVGVPESYLDALVGHESGGDPNAKAPTSTATGHGQFIESTWLRLMRERGQSYGVGEGALANLSDADLLELRQDPTWSALMIGEYARENESVMRQRLGRTVRDGEVYLGHWLGPEVAATLIKTAATDARTGRRSDVRAIVGDAAFQANLPVMYSSDADIALVNGRFVHRGGGRLLSPAALIARQTARFGQRAFFARDRGQ